MYGSNFSENVELLNQLNILEIERNRVSIKAKISDKIENKEDLGRIIAAQLINNDRVFGAQFIAFINNFECNDSNKYSYEPSNKERLKYSALRNLLLEIDVLEEQDKKGLYIINDLYLSDIFIDTDCYDLEKLERNLENQRLIGHRAELAILEYEEKRIRDYPNKELKIEHTSQVNVLAGYDIKSWDIEKNSDAYVPRYIEVKAIPKNGIKFYWTRNEKVKAKLYSDKYYLYLLPVISRSQFSLDDLIIIKDPENEIFDNVSWEVLPEVYKITKT